MHYAFLKNITHFLRGKTHNVVVVVVAVGISPMNYSRILDYGGSALRGNLTKRS